MEEFIRRENLRIFRQQLALVRDDAQRQLLLKLLAQEEAKGPVPTIGSPDGFAGAVRLRRLIADARSDDPKQRWSYRC